MDDIGAVNSLLRVKGLTRYVLDPRYSRGTGPLMGTYKPFILASESPAEECRRDDTALPYDSVVVVFAPTQFDYVALNTAFRVLMNKHSTRRG